MWMLESHIEYEGKILHGVFTSKLLANNAKKYLKSINYNTQRFIITKIDIDKILTDLD